MNNHFRIKLVIREKGKFLQGKKKNCLRNNLNLCPKPNLCVSQTTTFGLNSLADIFLHLYCSFFPEQ